MSFKMYWRRTEVCGSDIFVFMFLGFNHFQWSFFLFLFSFIVIYRFSQLLKALFQVEMYMIIAGTYALHYYESSTSILLFKLTLLWLDI